MSKDPYAVLEVGRDADDAAIRRAYRRLAKTFHPDLNPDDRKAEERFKQITAAYNLLSDPEKRARFDRGEIDADGAERPHWQGHPGFRRRRGAASAGAGGGAGGPGAAGYEDISDLFSDLFGRAQRGPARGADARYSLSVDFLDAVNGAQRRVTLPDGRSLDVAIPPGLQDGQTLRLRGQGHPGPAGSPAGDALVEVSVRPHPLYRREGSDLHMDLPVSPAEAVGGARITVPTPSGSVTLSVPRHSNSGRTLRLRGKGVAAGRGGPAGDLLVRLVVTLPDTPDSEFEAALKAWEEKHPYNPRGKLEA